MLRSMHLGRISGRPSDYRAVSFPQRVFQPDDISKPGLHTNLLMKSNLTQLAQSRKELTTALGDVRRISLQATGRGDYRLVGKLTLEAARLNRAISDVEVQQEILAG